MINAQTIQFWNLQLQLCEYGPDLLDRMVCIYSEVGKKVPKCFLEKDCQHYTDEDKMELATFIALRLSGLK